MGKISKGLAYIQSIPFYLKIAAFIVLLIALGTLGTFLDKIVFGTYGKKERLEFSMFVIVVSWLLVILMAVLFVSGLHEKISVINWPLTAAINMAIWALLLFISACLIADTARQYDKSVTGGISLCDFLDNVDHDAKCGHLIAASIMCFIATIIFGVDAFLNIKIWRGAEPSSSTAAAPPAPANVQSS
ncbi:plasmolipin-like [Dendronephthya gigantea]|uniref:plasmolipin-like n=1 Tax=Dendronephthya gigantea TaxID=151771 RepID=UPI00106C2C48|nr:plasmolipin-like [Dendronephthya gigantea]XP_028392020.1 plasmolipin-like [Dendronephthya gigantea]